MNAMIRYLLICLTLLSCNFQDDIKVREELMEIKNLTIYPIEETIKKEINLKKDLTIVDSFSTLIGRIGDIVVDKKGRIFITDLDEKIIHVYNSDGLNITQLGRKGLGPGEFSYLKSLQITNEFLYAIDTNFGIRKAVKFDLNDLENFSTILLGENRKEYRELSKAYPGIYRINVIGNGTYLAEFVIQESFSTQDWQNNELTGSLYLLKPTGNIKSDLFYKFEEAIIVNKSKGLKSPIRVFFGSPFIEVSSTNEIYITDPQLFMFKKFNAEGIYERAFYYPVQEILLNPESAAEAGLHEYFIQNMKFIKDLPSNWPVIREMKIDDKDRIWVAVTVNNLEENEWWILNSSGALITRFRMPRSKTISFIRDGYIYTFETNRNTGFQKVIRYKFELI